MAVSHLDSLLIRDIRDGSLTSRVHGSPQKRCRAIANLRQPIRRYDQACVTEASHLMKPATAAGASLPRSKAALWSVQDCGRETVREHSGAMVRFSKSIWTSSSDTVFSMSVQALGFVHMRLVTSVQMRCRVPSSCRKLVCACHASGHPQSGASTRGAPGAAPGTAACPPQCRRSAWAQNSETGCSWPPPPYASAPHRCACMQLLPMLAHTHACLQTR